MLESLGISLDSNSFSPLALFLQADIVVKAVMIGLLLASIWVWTIIVAFSLKLSRLSQRTTRYENAFWKSEDLDKFYQNNGQADLPIARIFTAGISEWRQSTARPPIDRDGARQRLSSAMNIRIAEEIDTLSARLNFLATTGSVAPFIGLFGTVWGIMRSFSAIAAEQNSSLAVVAPGIAEALFATAIGLFAAIPAVIAYNRFAHLLNMMEAKLGRFADRFHIQLSRELDRQG